MVFGNVVEVIVKAKDEFSKTFTSLNSQLKQNKMAIAAMGTAMVAASALVGRSMIQLGKASARAQGIQEGFNQIFGVEAEKSLKRLKDATRSAVSEVDIMKSSIQASLLGIDTALLPEMFEGALAIAQATGQPISKAIEDITIGIGRQSKLILDNLGIIVDAELAYKKFADTLGISASQLTDVQKKAAFANETIVQLNKNTDAIGGVQINASLAFQQLAASIDDLKISLGEGLIPVLLFFTEAIQKVTDFLSGMDEGNQQTLVTFAAMLALVTFIAGSLAVLGVAATALGVGMAALAGIIFLVAAAGMGVIMIFKDWENILMNITETNQRNMLAIVHATQLAGALIKNVWTGVWNFIVEMISAQLKFVVKMVNKLIAAFNFLTGSHVGKIKFEGLDRVKQDLVDIQALKKAHVPLLGDG